jgi:hypothetical protein
MSGVPAAFDHQHEHPHAHPHGGLGGESYAHVLGGPTVLDIGGDVGALVATMDDDTVGTEVHLRSQTRPGLDIHTGVWRRGSGSDAVTAAVFAELLAGSYWVLDRAGDQTQRVDIRGGALATLDLRNKVPIR